MHTEVKPRKARSGLGREVQSKIGQQLRAMYDDVVSQGVPDRFADLLRQLDVAGGDPSRPEGRVSAEAALSRPGPRNLADEDDKESR